MFYEPHRHKPPQGSYNVLLCVQASIVYASGNQQADEILISPNHVSTETKYLTDTETTAITYWQISFS